MIYACCCSIYHTAARTVEVYAKKSWQQSAVYKENTKSSDSKKNQHSTINSF